MNTTNQAMTELTRGSPEYGHRYAVLFIVLSAVLMVVIDGTMINIALPP